MDAGFHHERIRSDFFDRAGFQRMALLHDGMTDAINGVWLEQTKSVPQRLVMERGFVEFAEPHNGSQTSMIVGQIVQLIVSETTAEPDSDQHADVRADWKWFVDKRV